MRTSQSRVPFHALRSGAISIVVVLLAAVAHLVGGGELPSAPVLLALVALTTLAATLATRFKLNFFTMAGLLGAGQLALHEAFTALSPIAVSQQQTNHHLGGEAFSTGLDISATHTHELGTAFGAMMFVGHVLATIVSAVILAKGEDALWQLAPGCVRCSPCPRWCSGPTPGGLARRSRRTRRLHPPPPPLAEP